MIPAHESEPEALATVSHGHPSLTLPALIRVETLSLGRL
jgi:hypothetical protein